MKYLFHYILLYTLTTSCIQSQKSSFDVYKIPSDSKIIKIEEFDFSPDDINDESSKFRFSEIYSDVKYIKLEVTENSSLSDISKMEVTKDGDFIVFDRRTNSVVRFDSTGHFVNQIGRNGKSREEYIEPLDMQYDPINEQIVIYDNAAQSLKFYNIDGTYVERIKFDFFFKKFTLVDGKYIVIFKGYSDRVKDGDIAYNYKVFDRNGLLLKEYEPYTRYRYFTPQERVFTLQNGRIYCKEWDSPLIFTFNKTEIENLYYLDFGKKQIPLEKIKNVETVKELENMLVNTDNVCCRKFYETKNKYIMELMANGRYPIMYMQDKQNQDNTFAKTYGYNDIKGAIDVSRFIHVNNEKVYYLYGPEIFDAFLDNLRNHREQMESLRGIKITDTDISFLEDMSNHNNPILQICTLN